MSKNRLSGEKHPLNLFFADPLKSARFTSEFQMSRLYERTGVLYFDKAEQTGKRLFYRQRNPGGKLRTKPSGNSPIPIWI
jgi:hypothetical protein